MVSADGEILYACIHKKRFVKGPNEKKIRPVHVFTFDCANQHSCEGPPLRKIIPWPLCPLY